MEKKGIKKEVKMYFVIPKNSNPEEVEDSMKMAFQESKEAALSPQWIKESECTSIPPSKNVVFVLQEFKKDSEVFMKLRTTKCLVCGPMCLRSCLAENKPIPDNKSPVFTTAMRDVVVTASQVSVEIKAEIKEKVSFMGGIYMSNLADAVTHLVTNAVRSAKYEVAAEKGLPIMKVDWVDAVWRESQNRNVKATDPDLMATYKCPVFYNMFIACSNLSKKEKEEIKTLVTKHGGTFTPSMRQSETTLLVLKEPQGVKYQHARSWDLPCVRPSYIYESVEKGYAVSSKDHLIEPTVLSSTPTKEDDVANFTYNSDPSISVINFESTKTSIDDTQMTNFTQLGNQLRPPLRPTENQYVDILNTLTISDAKKAGSFVDGCKVFLSGFTPMDVEKLMRILSLGGATVFSELTESVSHVLLGEFVVDDVRALSGLAQKPHVVTLDWLVACIKQRSPVAEEPYYCLETRKVVPEPPSPLSQKGMQLLKPQFDASETSKMPPPPEPAVNRKLFTDFLRENMKSPAKQKPSPVKQKNESMNSTTTSQDSVVPDLLLGKKFLIVGYNSDMTERLEDAVEVSGGSVVAANFKGVADYAIVPLDTPVPNVTALELVTYLWLDDCIENKEVLETQYYHQPFSVDEDKQPLSDCCVSLSNYYGCEKTFLIHLAMALGATYQDSLAKVAKQRDDIELFASTHLICPEPGGKKYEAAARWGLPIVTKDWLLACAHSNSKVPESSFFVTERTEDSTSTGYHSKTPGRTDVKTAGSSGIGVMDTPKPFAKRDTDPTFTDQPPAAEPMSSCSRPSTSSDAPGALEATFQTPPLPHRAINSLKRKSSAMTPDDQSPFHVSTPETPYGQAIATPSTESKKRWKRFIEDFPSKPKSPPASPKTARRQSTPLSELKRRAFAKALETSEENINPNYSIEEMEEMPESETNQPSVNPSPLREDCDTPKTLSAKCNKSMKGNASLKATAGWSTPTANDFKTTNGTPSSTNKCTDTPEPEKRSLENEMVCKMLGQLHQRLSNTPNQSSEEKRTHHHAYKQLANYNNQPSTSTTSAPVPNTILDPESQPILIGWEDPVETAERAKMMNTSSTGTIKPRKFVLSSVAEREAYEAKLRGLGESLCQGAEFDQSTTHLIVDKPLRSEKILCCMAGGRWVLHCSYIDRMVQCGKYVPEEEKYEFGNPLSRGRLPLPPPGDISRDLAQAAYRWRKKIDETGDGAFKGLKAMLFTTPSKSGSLERLITAGGGTVLPSILSSVSSATHCFIEQNRGLDISIPLSEFVAHNVPCLLPVFLSEMLTNPSPNVQDSLIPEYKKLLALKK